MMTLAQHLLDMVEKGCCGEGLVRVHGFGSDSSSASYHQQLSAGGTLSTDTGSPNPGKDLVSSEVRLVRLTEPPMHFAHKILPH